VVVRIGRDEVGSFARRSTVVVGYDPTVAEVRRVMLLVVAGVLILPTRGACTTPVEARGQGVESSSVWWLVEWLSSMGVLRVDRVRAPDGAVVRLGCT
jgi:hypothetical protein